jgi:signal transduction histidine kinase
MSIKMKLLVSYLAMILIPAILIILTGHFIDIFISPSGQPDVHGEVTFGINFRNDKNKQLYQLISQTIQTEPERFIKPDSLRKFEKEHNLPSLKMGIIIIRNEKTVYISSGLPKILIQSIRQKKINFNQWLIIHKKAFSFQHLHFIFKKGEPGDLYLLTDATSFYRFGKNVMFLILLALALFIILTNGLLTYFMSRNIVRPLRALQNATEQIKVGNLDFNIAIHSRDELGKLAEAFEEMRFRLKESLEMQMQYETNRKELIAGISHDLKTPVTSIKGYVEGIIDGVADSPEKLQRYLATIQAKANSLDGLIDELFLFSKLDLGKLPFQFEKVCLQELVLDFYQEFKLELNGSNINISFEDHSRRPIWIMADREKLVRVIRNLVDNSLKYISNLEEHRIILGIKDEPEVCSVWVGDNGRGISARDLPFIFDSFFRADRARNTDTDGSGLGLAIAKRIIMEHGGRIWAESDLGAGTTIYFSLPQLLSNEQGGES